MNRAKKEDWNTEPFPALTRELPFVRHYTPAEMEKLAQGLVPMEMEQKWFVYFDDNTLHFHRSWTGNKIYEVSFLPGASGGRSDKAVVNCDPSQYRANHDCKEEELLDYLINRLLLDKDVPFPS